MSESKHTPVTLEVSRDGLTDRLQLSINLKGRHGYRLAGPKFSGSSVTLLEYELTARDVAEIRSYLRHAAKATGGEA